jgi:hypothetical protein
MDNPPTAKSRRRQTQRLSFRDKKRVSFTRRNTQLRKSRRRPHSAPTVAAALTERKLASAELRRVPTASYPDIVIYVVAHGRVIQTEKMPHKILWHSIIPVNGCSNYSDAQFDTELINILYEGFRTRAPQTEILTQYCAHIDPHQSEFFKSSVFFSLKTFKENIDTLTPQYWSANILAERDTLSTIITGIVYKISKNENVIDYLTKAVLPNCRVFFQTLIKDISTPRQPTEKQNEYMNVYNGMRRINKMEFELKQYFADPTKYSCTKFRRIKLNKHYYFENLPAESGFFVVYDRINAAPTQPTNTHPTIKKINIDDIEREGAAVSLVALVQMLRRHGYKNIAVFDNSCNSAEEAKAFRPIQLPEMQRSVSAAVAPQESMWMSNLSAPSPPP